MSTLLFTLVFTVSGVSYTPYTNISLGWCVHHLIEEQKGLAELNAAHPTFRASVSCVLSTPFPSSVKSETPSGSIRKAGLRPDSLDGFPLYI